ncbi:MAG TPA: hypothetical protein VFO16_04590, partial [Pseudonocardiaceae bacterium]|nr:hypothetical protein [Pseudonocardiaceae bacterium]
CSLRMTTPEVATNVTGSLSAWGCWDAGWSVPTSSGITQARKRLGPMVLAEVFERVAGPVATRSMRGAWLREWRLLAIDGFDVDLPDTDANVAEFGYAGSGDNRSAFPKARVVALAECGTHAFVAAEAGAYPVGEKTLAHRLYQRLRRDELLTADRNFYCFQGWGLAAGTGAALLWRAPTQLELPVVKVLSDGTYLSVLINPTIRGARRRAAITRTAREIAEGGDAQLLDPAEAHLVRVVEYDVPDREGNGAGQLRRRQCFRYACPRGIPHRPDPLGQLLAQAPVEEHPPQQRPQRRRRHLQRARRAAARTPGQEPVHLADRQLNHSAMAVLGAPAKEGTHLVQVVLHRR